MTVSEFELVCPQCGGDDIKADIHPEPFYPGAIGRIEALCAYCGRLVTAYIPGKGVEQQPALVAEGNGAYVIVTTEKTYYGRIETEWCDMHEHYFREVFASPELICGRVTRWDDEKKEPVTIFSHGNLEAKGPVYYSKRSGARSRAPCVW